MTLPEGWAETTLGDCQAKTSSIDPRRDPNTEFDLFSVPAHASYEPDRAFGSEIGSAKQQVKAGDVLLCKIVPHIRRGWVVPAQQQRRPQIASGEWIVFRGHALEPEFLRRFVVSDGFHEQFMLTVSGVGGSLMRARPADAAKISVPVPPAAEQRRIVAKLDALTARLARARAELDRVPVLATKLRLNILEQTFRKHSETPHVSIASICKVGTGSTPKRGEPRYYSGGDVPWVTSGSVNDGIVTSPTEHITPIALRETNCKVFPPGSILVALYGEGKTRGMVATLGIAAATNQALAVLHTFHADVRGDWIRLFLQARYEETRAAAAGGVQPNLNLGIVKAIELPLPSLSEQDKRLSRINAAFARADRLEAEAIRARALIDRLEAAIFARAFRGELVPQDPADEPASVLLDRIRAQRAAAPKAKRGRKAAANAA